MSAAKLPMTHSGSLEYGVEYQGELHYDFEMRLTTVGDNIAALEQVGAASGLSITLAMYVAALTRLGTIPKEELTFEFLKVAMADGDFDVLGVAQAQIKKKRRRSSEVLPDTDSPSSLSDNTASAKPPSEI